MHLTSVSNIVGRLSLTVLRIKLLMARDGFEKSVESLVVGSIDFWSIFLRKICEKSYRGVGSGFVAGGLGIGSVT